MMRLFFLLFFSISMFSQGVENFEYFHVGYGEKGTEWVSYFLTDKMIEGDTVIDRKKYGKFKKFNGTKTSDYTNTNFDRGHLAAADTFSFDLSAYIDTYSLANVVPQNPTMNRQAWRGLEVHEKMMATKEKCIFVLIDVEYGEEKKGKLWIPEKMTKTIYTCDLKPLEVHEYHNIFE